jgi:hypothetical protein
MSATTPKAGATPRRVIAIDVESQTRPVRTPYKSGHHPRETYDGDMFPRSSLEPSEAARCAGSMKVIFKVRKNSALWALGVQKEGRHILHKSVNAFA